MGFVEAKRLVEPFIKSLSASDTRDKIAPIGMMIFYSLIIL
jgi:hypothetical protein